ncbi:MAG: hypothetical protein LBV62_01875 [Rickettsiales bacterium]|nr:hypothetical protein [Rickettsiales bacterium]
MPRHWDPENLTLNERVKWLHNKDWIPVPSTTLHGLLNYFSYKY